MAQAPALADERRYRSLDALRGVAALSVVLLHFSNIFVDTNRADFERISDAIKLFAASPLGFLIEGSQAVLVFFVLSGFVLTLMLERGMHYGEYAVRRIARLYIPYIASIICAIVLIQCFGSRPLPDQSKWLNEFLGVTVTRAEVVNHVLFIGNYDSEIFNFVIWSLVLEMRISLVFPALLAAVRRFGATRSILASLAVSLIVIAGVLLHAKFRPSPTLHYILFFVVGINLALHRVRISAWYASLTMSRRTLSAIVSLGLYVASPILADRVNRDTRMLCQWLELPAIAYLIVACINSAWLQRLLATPLLAWLGKVSYSLYLFHGIILVNAMSLWYGKVNTFALVAGCLASSFVVAEIGYRLIERPSIGLSHRWARAVRNSRLMGGAPRSLG